MNPALLALLAARVAAPAGGFSPADLPGLIGWYDASDPATVTLSGANVTAWADKSPAGAHFAYTSGTAPTIESINGHSALRSTTSPFQTATTLLRDDPRTVIAVLQYVTTTNFKQPLSVYGLSTMYPNGSNVWQVYDSSATLASTAAKDTVPHVTSLSRSGNGGTLSLRIDGTQWDGTAGSPSRIMSAVALGNADAGGGARLGELIVCDGALSAGDIASAEAYLHTKWGIA